jgi:hypothetical protein
LRGAGIAATAPFSQNLGLQTILTPLSGVGEFASRQWLRYAKRQALFSVGRSIDDRQGLINHTVVTIPPASNDEGNQYNCGSYPPGKVIVGGLGRR